jgi:hypothetical protein
MGYATRQRLRLDILMLALLHMEYELRVLCIGWCPRTWCNFQAARGVGLGGHRGV